MHLYIIALLPLLAAGTCKKEKGANGNATMEDCHPELVQRLKQNVKSPPTAVWEYAYNGQRVFYVTYACCDQFNELYDDQCELLCYPDGGFTGKGDGQCADFMKARSGGKLLWSEPKD